jgi:hypothetical protein
MTQFFHKMFKEHGKEDLEVKISNQFATLENMSR